MDADPCQCWSPHPHGLALGIQPIPVSSTWASENLPWNISLGPRSLSTHVLFHRITESSGLQKTSEILEPNSSTTKATNKLCPQMPHLHIFPTFPGMGTPPRPWPAWSSA